MVVETATDPVHEVAELLPVNELAKVRRSDAVVVMAVPLRWNTIGVPNDTGNRWSRQWFMRAEVLVSSTEAVPRLARLPSRLLSRAALLASRLVTEALDEVDGHRYEFAVLVTLAEAGPASQTELCHRCGIDRSDMTALVTSLAEAGHVARLRDPADARRKLVHLEPSGRARLDELEAAVSAAQEVLLDGWSVVDRNRLVTLLMPLAARAGP